MIKVGKYILTDERKYRRVFEVRTGGFGPEAKEADVLAYYEKFGGNIVDAKDQVVPKGTFWNFEDKKPMVIKEEKPKAKPKVAKKKAVVKKKK